jgi:hypothetical protein
MLGSRITMLGSGVADDRPGISRRGARNLPESITQTGRFDDRNAGGARAFYRAGEQDWKGVLT